MHYRSKCCGHLPEKLVADFTLSGLIDKYIREIFEERKVSEELREKLWKQYFDKLTDGIDEGYSPGLEFFDEDLADRLKTNIAEFSAFKETSFKNELEKLLVQDGHLVSWDDFKKQAMELSGDYNVLWLEAEYHQTVATANMAAKWEDFQRNKDLYPNLKYVTVGDSRVRPEHKVWEGVIKPLDDPWWDTHLPPNDWGCRCDVEQTDDEPTETPTGGTQLKMEFGNMNFLQKSGQISLAPMLRF